MDRARGWRLRLVRVDSSHFLSGTIAATPQGSGTAARVTSIPRRAR